MPMEIPSTDTDTALISPRKKTVMDVGLPARQFVQYGERKHGADRQGMARRDGDGSDGGNGYGIRRDTVRYHDADQASGRDLPGKQFLRSLLRHLSEGDESVR